MELFNLFIKDPVVLFSFGGLAIVLAICSFYVYYFMKHIQETDQQEK